MNSPAIEDSSLMVGRTKGEFYALEKKLGDFSIDLKAENILTTVQKIEFSVSNTYDVITKILIDNGLISSETRVFLTEEKPKKGEEEEVDATVKSYRDIHSVLADSKFYLVANLKAFLDAHLTSDRYSLLEKKKKLEEQLYVVRDANGEYRRQYDIAARDRESVSIRSITKALQDSHAAEMKLLNMKSQDLSTQVGALSLQVEVLKRDNRSLKEDGKKKDEHLKLLNKLAVSNAPAAQQTGTQKSKKDKEIRQPVKIETVTVVAPCKRCPDLEKELQERIQTIEDLERNLKQLREELDETEDKSVALGEEKKNIELVCDMLNKDLAKKTAEAEVTHSALIETRLALQKEKGINEQHQVGAEQLQERFKEQAKELEVQLSEVSERYKTLEIRVDELEQLLVDASEQYANLEERCQDVETQLDERVKQCMAAEERCKGLEALLSQQERAHESEDNHHHRRHHPNHHSTNHGHTAHHHTNNNHPHHHHNHNHNHNHHQHKSHGTESNPEPHAPPSNPPAATEPANNNPTEQPILVEENHLEGSARPAHHSHPTHHDHHKHSATQNAHANAESAGGGGGGGGAELADQSDPAPLPSSTQPPAPTKPKYISLMSIRSNSGILSVARQNPTKTDGSPTRRLELKSAPAPISGGEQQLKGILKPISATFTEQLAILTPATQFQSSITTTNTNKSRNVLQRSFNDEESPMPSAHSKHGQVNSPQMLSDLGRRPHTTGTAHFQEPVSNEVDINMDSSREHERVRYWQPSSPTVKISRNNQDVMLLWEQQQQQQQLAEKHHLNNLLQITVALKDKLSRTEQERDRHAAQIGLSEKRREASESLCQLKLKESSLLLQELSEQLVAARKQIADLQKHRSEKEEWEKRERELATKLVDAEMLLPKIDKAYQVQGKNSFPAGSVKKKFAGSKSESRLKQQTSPNKPSRSLSPPEKRIDHGITNKARVDELKSIRVRISGLSKELSNMNLTPGVVESQDHQRFVFPPNGVLS